MIIKPGQLYDDLTFYTEVVNLLLDSGWKNIIESAAGVHASVKLLNGEIGKIYVDIFSDHYNCEIISRPRGMSFADNKLCIATFKKLYADACYKIRRAREHEYDTRIEEAATY